MFNRGIKPGGALAVIVSNVLFGYFLYFKSDSPLMVLLGGKTEGLMGSIDAVYLLVVGTAALALFDVFVYYDNFRKNASE